jgi:hypothetical protein
MHPYSHDCDCYACLVLADANPLTYRARMQCRAAEAYVTARAAYEDVTSPDGWPCLRWAAEVQELAHGWARIAKQA